MVKKQAKDTSITANLQFLNTASQWQEQLGAVAKRFNREFERDSFDLPAEVEAMPIFHDWTKGSLQARIASPFWETVKPKKKQDCLDLGCGMGFLIYPWRDWEANFYGRDISRFVYDAISSRGPQLNSKLFKAMTLGPAHQLEYEPEKFDLAIATGFSCYYPLDYWQSVLEAVKPTLKSGASFVFDVLMEEAELAENWAILETYLGAEVFLESLSDWEALIKSVGGKIVKRKPGELFQLYQVRF
ncbi:MAG: class I SAM-dependent methyltransferase [Cyanobacteria bacterium J06641_5]